MRRVVLPPLMLGLLILGMNREVSAQTLPPPPTAPPQLVIVITPTPDVWPTETSVPTETLTPTATPTASLTPAYADVVAYATVAVGEDDPGQLTAFRWELTAGDVLNAALLALVAGLLLLNALMKLAEWRRG